MESIDKDAVIFEDRNYRNNDCFVELEKLRRNDEFCDITLSSSNGKQVRAHKVVLAARIPYFKASFSCGLFQSDEVVLDSALFKFNECGIDNVVLYAYYGEVAPSNDITAISNTVVFADYLQLTSLKDQCASYLKKFVCVETCVDVANIAKTYSCSRLLESCLRFIGTNWTQMMKHPTWLNLHFDVLSDIFSVDEINAYDEDSILNALLVWVEHASSRKSFLASLLSNVHLSKLSASLMETLQKHSLLQENSECLKMVLSAVAGTTEIIPSPSESDGKSNDQNEISDVARKSKKAKIAPIGERTYFGNCMYVFGGKASVKFETVNHLFSYYYRINDDDSFERFSGSIKKWESDSPGIRRDIKPDSIPSDVVGAGVAIYNNTILMIGGRKSGFKSDNPDGSENCDPYDTFHTFSYYDVSKDRAVKNYTCRVEWYDEDNAKWYKEENNEELDGVGKKLLRQWLYGTSASCIEDTFLVAGGQSFTPSSYVEDYFSDYKTYKYDKTIIASVYLYNISSKKWTEGCSLKQGRMHHQMATLNNKVYCVGGSPNANNEVYDIWLDKWSTTCNLLQRRSGHALVATDSRLVAIGGKSSSNRLVAKGGRLVANDSTDNIFTTEYYDPRMKGWMKYVDMPIRSRGFTASELQGEIYLLGGRLGMHLDCDRDVVYEVYILDQRSNKWRLEPEALVSRMDGYSLVVP